MLQGLTGWHLVIILFIILLLFGAPKLPGLARSLGQSMKILKKEVRNDEASDDSGEGSAEPVKSETGAAAPAVPAQTSAEDEVAKARAEAEAAKRELEELKAQQAAKAAERDES
ncbi:twin-arginine translocase TatA/TatE family subunit [Leucobacter ruminantium]|uniref:Sec-independent protein translocase protein TatA n=1 Tax=Leucobacter ruminantium TaxID=1289170 RepID=A0A939LUY6_9MICO|nr:twin-arginine translocase TatA/TatE family subunit [Leucobacter ruminantium]